MASPNPSPNDALAGVAGNVASHPVWAVGNQFPSSRYQNLSVVATAQPVPPIPEKLRELRGGTTS